MYFIHYLFHRFQHLVIINSLITYILQQNGTNIVINLSQEVLFRLRTKLSYDKIAKKGGIRTSYEQREPRLLLIAADVETAKTAVFDSYDDEIINNNDIAGNDDAHVITINHVLASCAIPINFSYVEINGRKYWDGGILSNTPVTELIHKHDEFWIKRLGLDSVNSSLKNSESNNKLTNV